MSLPDEIERDLTLVHADTCNCDLFEGSDECMEVQNMLRLAIERAILLARVVERKITAAHHQCDGCGMAVDNLRAQADALKGGS